MKKSILMIDTPKKCDCCLFKENHMNFLNEIYYRCKAMGKQIEVVRNKPDWCPLIELPRKNGAEKIVEMEGGRTIELTFREYGD